MAVRGADWYDRASLSGWPLDDAATAVDDDGAPLPPQILADMSLRWPLELGAHAFVAGVTWTDAIATVLVAACESRESAGPFTPLAAVSVPGGSTTCRVQMSLPFCAISVP